MGAPLVRQLSCEFFRKRDPGLREHIIAAASGPCTFLRGGCVETNICDKVYTCILARITFHSIFVLEKCTRGEYADASEYRQIRGDMNHRRVPTTALFTNVLRGRLHVLRLYMMLVRTKQPRNERMDRFPIKHTWPTLLRRGVVHGFIGQINQERRAALTFFQVLVRSN